MEYLTIRKLPKEEKGVKTMNRMASFYTIIAGELYRQGYSQPLLKCVSDKCAQVIIEEMYEGICRNHAGSRALTSKILRAGYFGLL